MEDRSLSLADVEDSVRFSLAHYLGIPMNVHLLNPARSTELLVKALYRLAVPRSGFEVSTLCFAFERPVRSLNVAPESPTRAFETKLAVTIGCHSTALYRFRGQPVVSKVSRIIFLHLPLPVMSQLRVHVSVIKHTVRAKTGLLNP